MKSVIVSSRVGPRAITGGLLAVALSLGLVAARVPLALLLGGLAGVTLVTASLLEPLAGLGVALVVGPLRAWLELVAPGVAPHVGQAVLAVVLVAWALRAAWLRESVLPLPPFLWTLCAFLFVGLLSLLHPVDVWVGFLEWVKWVQVLLVMLVAFDRMVKAGYRAVLIAVVGLAVSGVFQASIGLWQFGLRGEGVEPFLIGGRFYRAYGTFQQPNPYAGMLGLIGALLVGMAMTAVVGWWQAGRRLREAPALGWIVLPALWAISGLGASWSRGGWMGFGAAILVMVVFLPRHGARGVAMVMATVALGGGMYAAGWLPSSIVARLTGFLAYARFGDVRGVAVTDATFAVTERMAHWQAALAMWRERFWLGVGLGCYEPAYPAYRLLNWVLPLGHAHNAFLNVAAEVGLLGLAAYLLWSGGLLAGAIWALARLDGWRRGLALGLLGAWVHLAAHSLVDNLMVNNVHLHVGVLAALTAYVVAAAQRQQRGDESVRGHAGANAPMGVYSR